MTHKCNYCKQIKPCRKNKIYSDGAGVGYSTRWIATKWVCKECDKYFFHEAKEAERKSMIDEEKRIRDFIKKRDAYLKLNEEVVKGGNE